MKNSTIGFYLIAFVFMTSAEAKRSAIYGEDNRKNLSEVTNPQVLLAAKSTAVLIGNSKMQANGALTSLTGIPLPNKMVSNYCDSLAYGCSREPAPCDEETFGKFYHEPVIASCTGVLVAPRIILTAQHCIEGNLDFKNSFYNSRLAITKWVFDFTDTSMISNSAAQVKTEDVYTGVAVLAQSDRNTDFALVLLDREVPRPVVQLKPISSVPDNVPLFTVGSPSGLPLKVSEEGQLLASSKEKDKSFFYHDLDVQGGNSGGPVFDATTNELIGINVRGLGNLVLNEHKRCIQPLIVSKDNYFNDGKLSLGLFEEAIYVNDITSRVKSLDFEMTKMDYRWTATSTTAKGLKISIVVNEVSATELDSEKNCSSTKISENEFKILCQGSITVPSLNKSIYVTHHWNPVANYKDETLELKVNGKDVTQDLKLDKNDQIGYFSADISF